MLVLPMDDEFGEMTHDRYRQDFLTPKAGGMEKPPDHGYPQEVSHYYIKNKVI